MEVLIFVLVILGVIFSVLSMILFFKVWGMCNNVDMIVLMLAKHINSPKTFSTMTENSHQQVAEDNALVVTSQERENSDNTATWVVISIVFVLAAIVVILSAWL